MAKALGKAYRQSLALLQIADKFGSEENSRSGSDQSGGITDHTAPIVVRIMFNRTSSTRP